MRLTSFSNPFMLNPTWLPMSMVFFISIESKSEERFMLSDVLFKIRKLHQRINKKESEIWVGFEDSFECWEANLFDLVCGLINLEDETGTEEDLKFFEVCCEVGFREDEVASIPEIEIHVTRFVVGELDEEVHTSYVFNAKINEALVDDDVRKEKACQQVYDTRGCEKNATRNARACMLMFGNRKLARRKVKECSKIGREHTKKHSKSSKQETVGKQESASKSRQARVDKQETASKSRQARDGKQESASKSRQDESTKPETIKLESISFKNEIKVALNLLSAYLNRVEHSFKGNAIFYSGKSAKPKSFPIFVPFSSNIDIFGMAIFVKDI
ncbi:hypothetical protein Tco_1405249 [Tanacetum coccineum]